MHELVLVSVHTSKLSDVVEGIQDAICQLKGVNVAKAVLNLSIDNQFCQAQDFSHQVEGVAKTRLLALLGSECFDRLQIEVVV